MSARSCLLLCGLFGFLAVALGAFGAHGLKDSGFLEKKYADLAPKKVAGQTLPASAKYLADFETGVHYHLIHALAVGLCGVIQLHRRTRLVSVAAISFSSGIVFFSGSLYVLVVGGPRWLGIPWGAITPIGGMLMLVGWVCLAVAGTRIREMS